MPSKLSTNRAQKKKIPEFINIRTTTIIKVILIFILFYFLFIIKEILAILFIALIFASAVDPWVDWMQQRKIPRGFGIMLIYLIALTAVTSVFVLMIPPIITQINELSSNFPSILTKVLSAFSALKEYSLNHGLIGDAEKYFSTLSENLNSAIGGVFSTVSGIVSGIFSFFLILVITFYMVVEENAIKKIVWSVAPAKHQVYTMELINRMQKKIGLWLRGQMILSLIIFALTYLGLTILGVQYALVLALVAGLTEFVPYLGPIFAAVPAIFLALTQSPVLAVMVAVLYYVIQLVENNIIVPKVMQKVVGLNPVVSIAVLLIGFRIGGIAGAILSIPVATALSVLVTDFVDNKTSAK